MTQRNVERLIGRLLTDEEFRDRFNESPERAVESLVTGGWELTVPERAALAALDRESLAGFARTLDTRIRKVSLSAEAAPSPNLGKEQS